MVGLPEAGNVHQASEEDRAGNIGGDFSGIGYRKRLGLGADVRVNGRNEVMRYLGIRSRTTLRRWRALGCPIFHTPTGRVFAIREELDAWKRPPGPWKKGGDVGPNGGYRRVSFAELYQSVRDAKTEGKMGQGA